MAITLDGTAGITTPPVTVTNIVGVGGATPAASGAGVTFPATQSASTDVNTLDDYKEGTWVPSQGAGLTVVGAFSSAGQYTKIGRQVSVTGSVAGATSVAAAANAILCGNLPYTVGSFAYYTGSASNNALSTSVSVIALTSSTNVYSAGAISAASGGAIYFSIVYNV